MKADQSAKRVDIVKLVKEGSVRYKGWTIHRPDDGYTIQKELLDGLDPQHFLVVRYIGSLNASLVHPREVLKVAILSSATAVIIQLNGTNQKRGYHKKAKNLKSFDGLKVYFGQPDTNLKI